ncbi:MAG: O-antigen ligase family protein [Thermoleophilia bacterium]|nr:O-antigen ligase family protein [Thermoleophilia bacterium]
MATVEDDAATIDGARSRLPLAAAIAAAGVLVFGTSLAFDLDAALGGAAILVLASALAALETRASVFSWPNALALFALLLWLVPIKSYRVPAQLPFDLEPYRIAILALAGAMLVALVLRRLRFRAGGAGLPLAAVAVAVLGSQLANLEVLDPGGGERNALKGFFYLMTFVLVFVLVCSAVRDLPGAERVAQGIVLGAVAAAVGAFYQSWTGHNVFDHLDDWVPGLVREAQGLGESRGGVLRVRSSAQHPIALGAALVLAAPLAVYLASRATSRWMRAGWGAAAAIVSLGAFTPVARTAVVMAGVVVFLACLLRGRRVIRFWPVLVIGLAVMHLARPGVIGALYDSFFPEQGLLSQVSGRAGLAGSGRLADIRPGLELWRDSPLLGVGRGNRLIGGRAPGDPSGIIFDNQYMNTLVTLGALGLAAYVSFLVAALVRMGRSAWPSGRPGSDFVAAAFLATAAFTAGMYFFDAFSFVQVTTLFFVIAALGLRIASLERARRQESEVASAG